MPIHILELRYFSFFIRTSRLIDVEVVKELLISFRRTGRDLVDDGVFFDVEDVDAVKELLTSSNQASGHRSCTSSQGCKCGDQQ